MNKRSSLTLLFLKVIYSRSLFHGQSTLRTIQFKNTALLTIYSTFWIESLTGRPIVPCCGIVSHDLCPHFSCLRIEKDFENGTFLSLCSILYFIMLGQSALLENSPRQKLGGFLFWHFVY